MTEDTGTAEPRYELKMTCEERAYPLVLAQLRAHAAAIRPLHPPRRVQSIYFDTHDGRALRENLAGVSVREKIRLRWYGEEARGVRAILERKCREALLGTKYTFALPEPIDIEGASRVAFAARVRALAAPTWRERLAALEPAVWIAYDRDYLATADGRVRVTIDRHMRCVDVRDRPRMSAALVTPTPRILVVELKAPESQRPRLEELVQHLPLKVDRCSKFVIGSAPRHAPIASWLGW